MFVLHFLKLLQTRYKVGISLTYSVLIICGLVILNPQFTVASDKQPFNTVDQIKQGQQNLLSLEEREWLNNHKNITFGYTDAFEPEVIVNEDGTYRGTLVDILDLLNRCEISSSGCC
ncbi:MAG: hypothetical protein ACI8ZB_004420 [Desulforhopalus sp.]